MNDVQVSNVLRRYEQRFFETLRRKPVIRTGDRAAIESLLQSHDENVLLESVDAMFAEADQFTRDRGFPLGLFAKQIETYSAKVIERLNGRRSAEDEKRRTRELLAAQLEREKQIDEELQNWTCTEHVPACASPFACGWLKRESRVGGAA